MHVGLGDPVDREGRDEGEGDAGEPVVVGRGGEYGAAHDEAEQVRRPAAVRIAGVVPALVLVLGRGDGCGGRVLGGRCGHDASLPATAADGRRGALTLRARIVGSAVSRTA